VKYLVLVLVLAFVVSCNNKEEKPQDKMPAGNSQMNNMGQMQAQPENNKVKIEGNKISMADISFEIPAKWQVEEPTSTMRISQFGVKDNPNLKIIGFYFGNMANMVEENIARWKNEFTNVESTVNSKAANNAIDIVLISGTFKKKPFPMATEFEEAPNYSTLACIIPSSEGPYFFKLVGPKADVTKESDNFKNFLNTYKKK
jgi:hypothetical protein